jgi:hypothetical protein
MNRKFSQIPPFPRSCQKADPHPVLPFCRPAVIMVLFILALMTASCGIKQECDDFFPAGPLPVTHTGFREDPCKLQFAIVSDLWGGYRPGVFEDAAKKLELLQPPFVMSVGDLIDGKTLDTDTLDRQWHYFDSLVNSLSMPFFYVPGNHDISNPWMETEWSRRLGRPYYYFIHHNVLFLCLNTQDGGSSGIGEEQIAYFRKAIKEHPGVGWIFVFMHRPVWHYPGRNEEGYERIEDELAGKNYTVFSGHHHTYLKAVKNGQEHFVLGSTGGGSDLRGPEFGEFDHITWVTWIKGGQPRIINLEISGMLFDDVRVEGGGPAEN